RRRTPVDAAATDSVPSAAGRADQKGSGGERVMQDESARLRQLPRPSDTASRLDMLAATRVSSRSSATRSAWGAVSVASASSSWVEGLSKETTRKRQTMLVHACGR